MATDLYVGGRWRPSSAPPIEVRSPHDGALVGAAGAATVADVDDAVAAAAASFEAGAWPRRPVEERIAVVERLLAAYAGRSDELARTSRSRTARRSRSPQLGQVGAIPSLVHGFLDGARSLAWEGGIRGCSADPVWREPVGVVAAITAWNVPQILIVAKLVPALLAGCRWWSSRRPKSPLDAMVLAELVDGLGLPEGVVSFLPGGPEVGRHLVAHPLVDKVAFTG